MRRRFALVSGSEHEGKRLDALVGAWLPSALGRTLSKSAVRRLIMAGAVRIEGRPVRRPGMIVPIRKRLEVDVDADRLTRTARNVPPERVRVLYEDEVLLAVDKPAGLPTHETADPARPHLVGLVKAYLGRDGGPAPYVGVHQRLDRDTSGVVLFAKDPSANRGLADAFAGRTVEKTYHALTVRPVRLPPATWQGTERLAPSGKRGVSSVASGGQEAETLFRLLESHAHGLLVEARPRTGRKHQIRVHLAEAGLAILGDETYGAPVGRVPRPMLHAIRLALPHPLTGEAVAIESPYPRDFEQALSRLREGRPVG